MPRSAFVEFWKGRSRNIPLGIAFGAGATSLALALAHRLNPVLGVAVLPPLLGAVLLSTWCGGRWAGVVSALLSVAGAGILFEPVGALHVADSRDVVQIVILGGVALAILLMTAGLRDVRDRMERRSFELEAALKDMREFTYAIAHNLRSPLRAMNGFARVLLEEAGPKLEEPQRALASRIVQASRTMDALVQGLLRYADLARVEVRLEALALGDVLRAVLAGLADEIEARKARVVLEGKLPGVLGERRILDLVMVHLVRNAITFVPPGTDPLVTITAEPRGARVRVWVRDNGIGIAPGQHERIFGLFERLNPDEDYPGTGLGLATVRRALLRMGGEIGLESEAGKGSRFWIELPVA